MLYKVNFAIIIISIADCLNFELTPVKEVVRGSLGGNEKLRWNIKKENKTDQLFTANLFLLGPPRRQLYTFNDATKSPVKSPGEDIFGERISADIQGGETYEVKLQNLSFSDKASFQLVAQINRGDITSNIKRSTVQLIVEGGPEICQGDIASTYTFNDNSSPTINIDLCGVPQPQVQVEFNGKKLSVLKVSINSYTHRFTLQLPLLTQAACGRVLTVTATGYNGSLVKRTNIFVENFTPDPVRIDNFSISNEVGCRLRVQWQPVDTGKCSLEYNIQFWNSCGTILGHVVAARNNNGSYCTDAYDDSFGVTMFATRKGAKGTETRLLIFFTTRKTAITKTKDFGKQNGIGIGIGIGIAICVIVFLTFKALSYFWFEKTGKKKHASRNTGTHNGEESVEEQNVMEAYQNTQSNVPTQSILPSQSTRVKQLNQAGCISHPSSNYTNQLDSDLKDYATLQNIELSRSEYQQLNM